MIKQICYRSSSQLGGDGRILSIFRDILRSSQRNNQAQGISGYLLFDKGHFAQVLEGEPARVDGAFARIKADPRHRGIVLLGSRERRIRQFEGWTMGGATIGALADREILLRCGLDERGWHDKLDFTRLVDLALGFAERRAPQA